jgi:hypothetical protein
MDFEFGETLEAKSFFERNPKFMPTFVELIELANKYLGNRPAPKDEVEEICFGLGHACRQDYLEAIFLAVNGYGDGATKITRSLFERSATLAYLVLNPTKVERFVLYGAVQEHRMLEAALKVVSESDFDAAVGPPNTVVEIRKRYKDAKPEFEIDRCTKCGTKRVNPSWDLDIAAMVHKLGGVYRQFYLPNYALPNSSIHATLSSAAITPELAQSRSEADLQVACASFLMLLALRSQEAVFHLGFGEELEACERAVSNLRPHRNGV